MLNFTTNIAQYTTSARTARTSNYTNYASKKQLLNANVLTAQQAQFVSSLVNCFCFALHNNKQYLVITFYYASTKSYAFAVANLHNNSIAPVNSVAQAKQAVNALVAQQANVTTATASTNSAKTSAKSTKNA